MAAATYGARCCARGRVELARTVVGRGEQRRVDDAQLAGADVGGRLDRRDATPTHRAARRRGPGSRRRRRSTVVPSTSAPSRGPSQHDLRADARRVPHRDRHRSGSHERSVPHNRSTSARSSPNPPARVTTGRWYRGDTTHAVPGATEPSRAPAPCRAPSPRCRRRSPRSLRDRQPSPPPRQLAPRVGRPRHPPARRRRDRSAPAWRGSCPGGLPMRSAQTPHPWRSSYCHRQAPRVGRGPQDGAAAHDERRAIDPPRNVRRLTAGRCRDCGGCARQAAPSGAATWPPTARVRRPIWRRRPHTPRRREPPGEVGWRRQFDHVDRARGTEVLCGPRADDHLSRIADALVNRTPAVEDDAAHAHPSQRGQGRQRHGGNRVVMWRATSSRAQLPRSVESIL